MGCHGEVPQVRGSAGDGAGSVFLVPGEESVEDGHGEFLHPGDGSVGGDAVVQGGLKERDLKVFQGFLGRRMDLRGQACSCPCSFSRPVWLLPQR